MKLRNGEPVAYLFATLFGHAGAETEEELLDLTARAARHLPPPGAHFPSIQC